jgi:adenylosuccinate lyase
MTDHFTHQTYLSPFTWRYGSAEMRQIWSELHKRRLWRRLWVALAEAQQVAGLVTPAQVDDLRTQVEAVDVDRAHQIEAEIQHDLMAEVKAFAEQCPLGGGIIHLGATSMDIEDNADALRLRESLDLILGRLADLLAELAAQIECWATTPIIGFTHLQPAEPTTVGYRLAQYGFDLLTDLSELRRVRDGIRGKGFKGAVGTSASYQELLTPTPSSNSPLQGVEEELPSSFREGTGGADFSVAQLEAHVMAAIDLEPFPVATQTYPRKQDHFTSLLLICACCKPRHWGSGPSLLAVARLAPAPCPLSAILSTPKILIAWLAWWPVCPALPGTMPPTHFWNAPWMTLPTGVKCFPRHF